MIAVVGEILLIVEDLQGATSLVRVLRVESVVERAELGSLPYPLLIMVEVDEAFVSMTSVLSLVH